MLQKGAIRRASFNPGQFVSNLFIIPKKSDDLRPVINLKPLNEFVQYHHFKMEGLNTLLDLLSGSEFFITIDDMAIISSSRELSSQEGAIVVRILESLGFIINKEKSVLIPSQKIVFLGFVIDSMAMTVSLPEEKLNKLKEQTLSLWERPQCSIRELAHVVGLIVSSFSVIKPARLYYHDLEVCKSAALSSSGGDYNAIVSLSQLARDSLQWFGFNSHLYNGTRITKPSKVITMTTDASHSGWGVVCDGVPSSGLLSSKEQAMHINWLELSAVLFGLKCFVQSHNCLVKVFCDNSTAVAYINNLGGMVPSLHAVSKAIWEWCFAHHCMLEAFHIPGSSNLQADSLSRQFNRNLEWKLHPTVFKWVSQSLFVPNIDLFASRLNFQTSVCFMVPGSRSLGRRRLFFLLQGIQTLYFPSFQFVRQNPNEAQDGGSFRCSSHSTLVANSTLVPTASPFIGPASYPSRAPNPASGGFSTPSQRCNAPSRVAYIRDNLQVRSEEFLQGQPATCSSHGVRGQKNSIQRLGNVFVAGVIGDREILFKQI